MADDPEVRAQRAIPDRKALVVTKLHDLVRRQFDIQSAIKDLEAVLTVVKAKRADLRNIQSHIKEQVKMCQEAIGLGGRWGSKTPPGKSATLAPQAARPVAKDPDDLSGLIENEDRVDREVHEVEPVSAEAPREPKPRNEESMDDLLRAEVLKAGGSLDGLEEWDEPESDTDDESDPALAPDPANPFCFSPRTARRPSACRRSP